MGSVQELMTNKGVTYKAIVRRKGYEPQFARFHAPAGQPRLAKEARAKAEAWVAHLENEMTLGRWDEGRAQRAKLSKYTMGDLIDEFMAACEKEGLKSLPNRRSTMKVWKRLVGDLSVTAVTADTIRQKRDLLAQRIGAGGGTVSPATLNRYVGILSAAWSWGVKFKGLPVDNPMARLGRVKGEVERTRMATPEERDALLKACSTVEGAEWLGVFIEVAIATGLRESNLLTLKWRDVDLTPGRERIQVAVTKNGKPKTAPLPDGIVARLRAWKTKPGSVALLSPYVFPSPQDPSKPRANVWAPWKAVCAAAGVRDFRVHDLRHTGASYLAMSGATIPELMDFLGHSSPRMAMRYTHLMPQHCDAVVKRMHDLFLK